MNLILQDRCKISSTLPSTRKATSDMADSNPAAQTDADANATPERRRSAIVDAVLEDGTLRIEGLADSLGVSAATIYRDVQILEDSGLLTLSKGELRPRASSTAELPPRMRRIRSRIEKGALAQAAARLVSAGNAVIIDDSSTALPMVPELAKVNPLTVITNSMPVARSLAASKNTELVLIGGRYYPWAEAFYGSLGTGFVKNLRADLCFMSDAAVWYDGVYNPTDYVTDMKRTMLEQSFHRVLMIDNSKFARRAWQKTTSLTTFETILVDDGATEQQLDMLAASGAEVTVVPVPGR